MSSQDLEADLTRCKQMQEAAAKCYWESKFDQAEELYRAALAVLETVYATDSSNIATCLQGLGDSYYFQDKFGLALPYYKRLFAARERMVDTDATEYVTALFKLAKTYDKLGEFEDAEFHYKKAAATAQKKLFLGHPLLTSLLEAYGKFLRRVKPGTEHAIEQQATLSREKYVDPEMLAANILEGIGGEKSTPLPGDAGKSAKKSKIWFSKSISEDSDHWLVKLLMLIKGNPKRTYAVLLSPFVLAFAVLAVSVVYEVVVDDAPQNAMVAAGQVFQTVDGHQHITFTKNGAEVENGGSVTRKPYVMLSNRWRELLFSLNNGSSEPWIVKTKDGLLSTNGTLLINANSPMSKMAPIMQKVSEQVYAKLNDKLNKKPDAMPDENPDERLYDKTNPPTLKLDAYTDPYDGFYTVPQVLIVKREQTDVRQQIENAVALYEISAFRDAVNTTSDSDVVKPGSVICLLVPTQPDDTQFYILGIGENQVLTINCKGVTPLILHGAKGVPPHSNCDVMTGSTEPRLIIARRTMKSLAEAKMLLGWALLLLIPFVLATILLEEQFNAKKVSERGLQTKIALLQTAVFIYCPFALMYLAFTMYAIYKAVTDGL